MEKLRVGIIGLGVGEKHIHSYGQHAGCEVVAMCDFSDERLAEMSSRYPDIIATKDAAEIIEDRSINVVSIASYDNYHYEQVTAALEAGKHVMVEKPLCLDLGQAERIRAVLRRKSELKLSSNLVLRTCPRFIRIREAIHAGEMGHIFYLEADYLWGRVNKLTSGWRADMDFYSIVHGAAIHMIDLVLWLMGEKPLEVKAYGNKIATADSRLKYNSFAAILMKFRDGCIAKVTANGGGIHPHFHRLEVFGTEKTAIHNVNSAQWIGLTQIPVSRHETRNIEEAYPGKQERARVITSFIDSILSEKAVPVVSADDVFNAMSVCATAENAMNTQDAGTIAYI